MAETTSRPATRGGRGSGRAGRGGHSSRGGRTSRHTNGDQASSEPSIPLDEQGELGQLKKQYLTETVTLKEMFPDWTDDDLVFALQETDGDLQTTIERITEGNISRFADVKKKTREKSKPKAAEASTVSSSDKPHGSVRGRGRGGSESARGGRGRGSDRGGRGSLRGGRGGAHRAAVPATSAPTADAWGEAATTSAGWGDAPAAADEAWGDSAAPAVAAETESASDKPASTGAWGAVADNAVNAAADSVSTPVPEQNRTSLIPEGTKKTWASMLSQPKQQPVLPKTGPAASSTAAPVAQPDLAPTSAPAPATAPVSATATAATEPESATDSAIAAASTVQATDFSPPATSEGNLDLSPPKDDLTEENLENLPDSSHPAATDTVLSTRDPRSAVGSTISSAAPSQIQASVAQPIGRPTGLGGYATTAMKATHSARAPSYNRRLLDQTEAVVLPKDHTVERTAVQFGSMGLGGDKPADVDDEREEAETRAQPPQQSPVQPRASLPPVQQATASMPDALRDTVATPKAAPGLPPVPQQAGPQHNASLGQPPYGQYARYPAPGLGHDQASAQKPYESFATHPQGQGDNSYPSGQQSQSSAAPQAPGHLAGSSLGHNDYASQYGTEHQRNAYQNYYGGSYGQQGGHQEHSHPPQRSGSNLGTSESGYGSQLGGAPSRFNETSGVGSGHNTPVPTSGAGAQQPYGPGSQAGHLQHQSHNQHNAGYPGYGNPYYGGSYYSNYMNQYPNQYGYGQQNYGQPYGNKSGMYGQPHHGYGVSPQASYDHSSSPANVGGFGAGSSSGGRDSGFGGGSFNDYSRSGSTQPSAAPSQPSGFGGGASASDGFARGNYGSHQTSAAGDESSTKGFSDNKTGPSPSLGQPGRTGSANTNPQSNFPPPGTQGFGGAGYPNHLNPLHSGHGSQQGGLGGLGGQYGGSAGFGGYNNQYGSYQRGWGGNYGGH